ncbi:MAG TPA: Flp family type IVb pilin [Candidatus Methylomirabilis sp.]|nr:Flp family type IVb pilin [Candidatus Methylomirabilis sp.]
MARGSGRIRKWMKRCQEGQALAEYAMILLFVAVACVAAVTLLGVPIQGFYTGLSGSF